MTYGSHQGRYSGIGKTIETEKGTKLVLMKKMTESDKAKIVIPEKITHDILEKLLTELEGQSELIDLEIPREIEYRGFGILPGLYSVVFSWMRHKSGDLIIPIDVNEEQIKEFASDYYGYLILRTLMRHCNIVNQRGESLKELFRPYIEQMHNYIESLSNKLPNEAILIPCFDHLSSEKGLSHWFYPKDQTFPQTPLGLKNSLYQIASSLAKIYTTMMKGNMDTSSDLRKILWELLINTDQHARTDYLDQVKLMPSTRGLFIRIQRSSKSNFISRAKHKGLKEYYERVLPQKDHLFILELSVFDSGPGLVKRFLGENWSNNQTILHDVNTVRKCLIKGQTSVDTRGGEKKGVGLDDVLKKLKAKKGFLKIRSGRVSVYRDLVKSPYKTTVAEEEIDLYDWATCEPDKFTAMGHSEGTIITLAYPLL